jgi:type IV pilus assembly protein PilW
MIKSIHNHIKKSHSSLTSFNNVRPLVNEVKNTDVDFTLASIGFKQKGIGLIELLVSMLIGLFIMSGVLQMFSTTSQNAVSASGASRIQENARFVFSKMAEDIAQTGNLGCVSTSNGQLSNQDYIENLLAEDAAVDEAYDFTAIINGQDAATATTLPAGSVALTTDTLNIRFVDNSARIDLRADASGVSVAPGQIFVDKDDPDFDDLRQYQIVALANCKRAAIFMITDKDSSNGELTIAAGTANKSPLGSINAGQYNTTNTLLKSEDYRTDAGTLTVTSPTYLYGGNTGSYLYFIGNSTNGLCSSTPITNVVPALSSGPENCSFFRLENGIERELVEGVSDMQVRYGWTTAAGELFFGNAGDASTIANSNLIDRVRVVLTLNSVDDALSSGNNIEGLLVKTIEQTFNLSNQL